MKRLAILGATGSIGMQALEVAAAQAELEVVALAAGSNVAGLVAAARATGAEHLALTDPAAAAQAAAELGRPVQSGSNALAALVIESGADLVLNAVVGAAGLEASLATLNAGLDLALANKESLVAGGELVLAAARAGGGKILPVDSEHSALQQCLGELPHEQVASLVITASGGPFRGRTRAELADITVEQALAHPTWTMGAKISIDSATLMNKGLEVIEARWLFDAAPSIIEVLIHPQSIVHSLVEYVDGSMIAQLSNPDMRVPIAHALAHPERIESGAAALDLAAIARLSFERPDAQRFPCLGLAYAALGEGGTAPAILNAANETAVQAFLAGRLRFTAIHDVIGHTLECVPAAKADTLEAVLEADALARRAAAEFAAILQERAA